MVSARPTRQSKRTTADTPDLYQTCMFTSYMTDYMPAIMREINSLYDVDAHYMNGLGPDRQPPCVLLAHNAPSFLLARTPAYWGKFNDRSPLSVEALRRPWRKRKSPPEILLCQPRRRRSHGGARTCRRSEKYASGSRADHSRAGVGRTNRSGDVPCRAVCVTQCWTARWPLTLSGAVVNRTGSGGGKSTKSAAEAQIWLDETSASGISALRSLPSAADMDSAKIWRLQKNRLTTISPGPRRHDPHFVNKRSIASIGVLIGQRTPLFYRTAARCAYVSIHEWHVLCAAGRSLPV